MRFQYLIILGNQGTWYVESEVKLDVGSASSRIFVRTAIQKLSGISEHGILLLVLIVRNPVYRSRCNGSCRNFCKRKSLGVDSGQGLSSFRSSRFDGEVFWDLDNLFPYKDISLGACSAAICSRLSQDSSVKPTVRLYANMHTFRISVLRTASVLSLFVVGGFMVFVSLRALNH